MLRQERWEQSAAAVNAAITGRQAEMWTAIPGIVQSFNAKNNTVEVQPSLQMKRRLPDGSYINETRSLCVDVPVHFQSGGGFTMTVPVKRGDECLLVFSSRCIDGWWDKGGVQPQTLDRMHDPSDGFAILGTRSKKRALANVSTDTVQLRADDGKTLIEIDAHQTVRIVAPTKIRCETPILEVTGTIKAGGDVQANAMPAKAAVTWTPPAGFGATPGHAMVEGAMVEGVDPLAFGSSQAVVQGILTVRSEIPQLLHLADNFTISGATNLVLDTAGRLVPGVADIINRVHQVASIIDSHTFTALLPALPGQIGQIGGLPLVSAIVHLLSHDHHGVQAGPAISQKPVTGT